MIDLNSKTLMPDRLNHEIDKALQAENAKQPLRNYLGASGVGAECERQIQYGYYHTPKDEGKDFPGRILRIFERGHQMEDNLARWMRLGGCELQTADDEGKQFGFEAGILKGHCDGIITGGPDCFGPFPRLWESKCIGDKYWKALVKSNLRKERPVYYAQCQIYMHYFGLMEYPALFSAINANDMQVYWESIEYDPEYFKMLEIKIQRIIDASQNSEILPRYRNDPTYFSCKWCDWYERCFGL
jgi:hypothetical protein